jgi:hypothetical protein
MSNQKTIYVKDSDLKLLKKVQEEFGESISSLFADFIRRRGHLTDSERKVLTLLKESREDGKNLKQEGAGRGLVSDFAQAEAYLLEILKLLKKEDFGAARNLWFGALACHDLAKKQARFYREIKREIEEALAEPNSARP